MSVSILLLTQDEAHNLPRCLDALGFCDDIVVLDSGSTDDSRDVARARGCRVFERAFDSFAGQRNWALETVDFRHRWVLHLDADEVVTPALRDEVLAAAAADRHSGYFLPFKLMFWGRWLKHAQNYPVYVMRLTKLGEGGFVQTGHGNREAPAPRGYGYLREPFEHYNFSKGLTEWIAKHNRYSSAEALENLRQLRTERAPLLQILSPDATKRRRALKRLSLRMPGRPWLKFLYMYVIKLGVLDGAPGLTYCALQAWYEYLIVLKLRELRRAGRHENL